jgi:hypothetical protein
MKEKLKDFINNTSYIYDLNDTLEWIMYNKEELLKILLEDKENDK